MINQDTQHIQLDLASYCKTGEYKPLPGVTPGRVHHYRRLVFNVVKNTLEQAYPISFDVMGEELWDNTIKDFFSNHDPQSPQVWKLPLEFYEWAIEIELAKELDMNFLADLLLFEWLEIEVFTMPDKDIPVSNKTGDLLSDLIVFNPEYRIIELSYPVHKVVIKNLDDHKGQYFVLAFRDQKSKMVEFIDLSIFYVFLIERIMNQGLTLADALVEAVTVFNLEAEKEIGIKVRSFFRQLELKGFVLGFTKKNERK